VKRLRIVAAGDPLAITSAWFGRTISTFWFHGLKILAWARARSGIVRSATSRWCLHFHRAATVRAHSIVLIATAPIRWNRVGAGNRGTAAADRLCRRKFAELIRQMSIANPLWGAPRIHGEVLKLGIEIGQTSVVKYMARRRAPSVVAGLEDVLS
jgi:hypothetical protein